MILRVIILALLAFILYRVLRGVFLPAAAARPKLKTKVRPEIKKDRAVIEDEMVQDPHCGSYFPRREAVMLRRGGENLAFCSRECREAYLAKLRRK